MSFVVLTHPFHAIPPIRRPALSKTGMALVSVVAVIATALAITPDRSNSPQVAEFMVHWVNGQISGITESTKAEVVTGVDLTVLEHERSVQALFEVANPKSPTLYRFENAVPAKHSGIIQKDGSVSIVDTVGNHVGVIAAPWAYDSNGTAVSTYYKVDGTTLIQTVEHSQSNAYPIIADPNWFDVAAVAAAFTVTAAGCIGSAGALCIAGLAVSYVSGMRMATAILEEKRRPFTNHTPGCNAYTIRSGACRPSWG